MRDSKIRCPTRARTWTFLNQNQACCQLHHRTVYPIAYREPVFWACKCRTNFQNFYPCWEILEVFFVCCCSSTFHESFSPKTVFVKDRNYRVSEVTTVIEID